MLLLAACALAAPAAAAPAPLSWAPPPLDRPTTIRLGDGYTSTSLDPAKDYVIELPPGKKRGATVIQGGRNVVIRGGWISIPPGQPDDAHRRAIYVKNNVGTVHIEGVLIDASEGGVSDGIDISAPQSTVQIQNVRVVGLQGSQAGFHADVIQPWGGVRDLRVDRLTGTSAYQGLYIGPDLGPIAGADLRRVDLGPAPGVASQWDGGHLLWVTSGASGCNSYPIDLSQVWVAPRAGRTLGDSVWPQAGVPSACGPSVAGGSSLTWPGLAVRGSVNLGRPPGGDWVPAGVAGLGYESPGYAGAGDSSPTPPVVVPPPPVVPPVVAPPAAPPKVAPPAVSPPPAPAAPVAPPSPAPAPTTAPPAARTTPPPAAPSPATAARRKPKAKPKPKKGKKPVSCAPTKKARTAKAKKAAKRAAAACRAKRRRQS